MNWHLIWTLVLAITLGLFAIMAVLVTIFGARDIRRLLAHLKASEATIEDPSPPASES